MANNVYVIGFNGFGDCIYQFPFVKKASERFEEVYLMTAFPFLYESLKNVKYVRPQTGLLTCLESMKQYREDFWVPAPMDPVDPTQYRLDNTPFTFLYHDGMKDGKSMMESWNETIPIYEGTSIDFSIPIPRDHYDVALRIYNRIAFGTNKKICLLHQPGTRKEWVNYARLPKTEYFQFLIDEFKDEYYFVSVGNKNVEDYIGKLHTIDLRFDYGELNLMTIMALASLSDMVISYISFLIACGVASGTKTFCLFGGYIRPEMWIDYKYMDMDKIGYVAPIDFCNCHDRLHECNKEIELERLYSEFRDFAHREEELSEA